jgi:hypothetical protein
MAKIINDEDGNLDDLIVRARSDRRLKQLMQGKKPGKYYFGFKPCEKARTILKHAGDSLDMHFNGLKREGYKDKNGYDLALFIGCSNVFERTNVNSVLPFVERNFKHLTGAVFLTASIAFAYCMIDRKQFAEPYIESIEKKNKLVCPGMGTRHRLFEFVKDEFHTADNALMSIVYSMVGNTEMAKELVKGIETHISYTTVAPRDISPDETAFGHNFKIIYDCGTGNGNQMFHVNALVALAQAFTGNRFALKFLDEYHENFLIDPEGKGNMAIDNITLAMLHMAKAHLDEVYENEDN